MSIIFCIHVLTGQLWIADETLGSNNTEIKIDLMNSTPLTLYLSLLGYSTTALTFHTLAVKILFNSTVNSMHFNPSIFSIEIAIQSSEL